MYFFWPVCLSSQERVCRRPSIYTWPPFFRYSAAISANLCQSTTLCHSVVSCQLPSLPLNLEFVATVIFATAVPCGVCLSSGSLPRCPTRMTLFTLFMSAGSFADADFRDAHYIRIGQPLVGV